MVLSIGMIVKDEEKYLGRCLEKLMPIISEIDSEIIIVDTGSSDNTVEIAKKYTDKVFNHKWNGSFADMRNKALSYCTGKWYFSLDADEIIDDPEPIISFFKSGEYKNYKCATVSLRNYTDSKDKSFYTMASLTRLFYRDYEFKYVGSIHEQPIWKKPIKDIQCTIDHYGYVADDEELMERKYKRNRELLVKELEKEKDNIFYEYQIAITDSMHKENNKAVNELEKVYLKLSDEQKRNYRYVVTDYARLSLVIGDIEKCKKICLENMDMYITDQEYKIDLNYYLAKCYFIEKKYDKTVEAFKEYFRLLDEKKALKLQADASLALYTIKDEEKAYENMFYACYNLKNYSGAIEYLSKMKEKDIFGKSALNLIIYSYIAEKKYKELYEYYMVNFVSVEDKKNFQDILEGQKLNISKEANKNIESVFASNNDIYGKLNEIRLNNNDEKYFYEFLDKLLAEDLNKLNCYYGDVLYVALKKRYLLNELYKRLNYDTIANFIDYCNERYGEEFSYLLINYVFEDKDTSFNSLRMKVIFERSALILDKISQNEYEKLFERYLFDGISFIKLIYSDYIIKNEMTLEVRNAEHCFFMFMMKAEEIKENDKVKYIQYLRKALDSYPYMNKGVEYLLNKIKAHMKEETLSRLDNPQMNKLKKELIDNIYILMSCDKTDDAKEIIKQYEQIVGNDMEIMMIKSQLMLNELKLSIKQ